MTWGRRYRNFFEAGSLHIIVYLQFQMLFGKNFYFLLFLGMILANLYQFLSFLSLWKVSHSQTQRIDVSYVSKNFTNISIIDAQMTFIELMMKHFKWTLKEQATFWSKTFQDMSRWLETKLTVWFLFLIVYKKAICFEWFCDLFKLTRFVIVS